LFDSPREGKLMKIYDLSHTIKDGSKTYPGLPAPKICDFWTRKDSSGHYDQGTSFQIGKIEMVSNTGTYLDAPFHRYADGADLSELPLSSLAGLDGLLIHAVNPLARSIDASYFSHDVKGKAVFVRTDWSKHWGTDEYFVDHPFMTEDAALFLRDAGAALVGIDSLNIDDTSGGSRPVHSTLLRNGIPIIEHMTNLDKLPENGFTIYALPPKIKGMGSFPVRVIACVD